MIVAVTKRDRSRGILWGGEQDRNIIIIHLIFLEIIILIIVDVM